MDQQRRKSSSQVGCIICCVGCVRWSTRDPSLPPPPPPPLLSGVSVVGSIPMDRYVHPVTAEFHRVGNFPSLPCYFATWLLCYKCICTAYYCFMLFRALLFCYSPRRPRAYLNFLPVSSTPRVTFLPLFQRPFVPLMWRTRDQWGSSRRRIIQRGGSGIFAARIFLYFIKYKKWTEVVEFIQSLDPRMEKWRKF